MQLQNQNFSPCMKVYVALNLGTNRHTDTSLTLDKRKRVLLIYSLFVK